VFARILNSMFPRRLGNFIADFVQPNPDLWGPFWLSTTLIFSIAIVGNLARFLQTYGSAADEYTSDFSFGQFLCTQNRMGSCRYFLDIGIWKIAVFRYYGIMSYGITSSLKYQYTNILPVTGATSLVFGYVLLLPAAIYSFLWYHRPTTGLQYSFFDLLCAYGYSMAIFIPVSASHIAQLASI
jgi:protein YIPF1/2